MKMRLKNLLGHSLSDLARANTIFLCLLSALIILLVASLQSIAQSYPSFKVISKPEKHKCSKFAKQLEDILNYAQDNDANFSYGLLKDKININYDARELLPNPNKIFAESLQNFTIKYSKCINDPDTQTTANNLHLDLDNINLNSANSFLKTLRYILKNNNSYLKADPTKPFTLVLTYPDGANSNQDDKSTIDERPNIRNQDNWSNGVIHNETQGNNENDISVKPPKIIAGEEGATKNGDRSNNFLLYLQITIIILLGLIAIVISAIWITRLITSKWKKENIYTSRDYTNRSDSTTSRPHSESISTSEFNMLMENMRRMQSDISSIRNEIKNINMTLQGGGPTRSTPSQHESPPRSNSRSQAMRGRRSMSQVLQDYHASLTRGGGDFLNEYDVDFIDLTNHNERSENAYIPPKLDRTENRKTAGFYGIKSNQTIYLLPSFRAYNNLSSLTSSDGRPAQSYFNGIFDIVRGDNFRVEQFAELDQSLRVLRLGEIVLPLGDDYSTQRRDPGTDEPQEGPQGRGKGSLSV